MKNLLKRILRWMEAKKELSWELDKYFYQDKLDRDYFDRYETRR